MPAATLAQHQGRVSDGGHGRPRVVPSRSGRGETTDLAGQPGTVRGRGLAAPHQVHRQQGTGSRSAISIYLRRSHDCFCLYNVCGFVCGCVCYLRASFTSFGQMLHCACKRIVNIMQVYIERKNIQVALIRFRKKYRLYSCLCLRSEEFNATDVFTLGK